MTLFNFFKCKENNPVKSFVGKWNKIISSDDKENVLMEFFKDGRLEYSIINEDKIEIIKLIYKIENNYLITDQPSHPQIEKTKFNFTEQGYLELEYDE